MAISNLRTGITIKQERKSASPNIQATTLPAVLVGLNRTLYFQEPAEIFDWSAGTAANEVAFPGYTSGVIEAGVANPTLKPAFFVQNTLGIADITDSVTLNDLDSGTPSFSIASGISSVFTIATGTAGCFTVHATETLSSFKDTGADFVYSQVRRGDIIEVSGVAEYQITGVLSDTEVNVRRIGKGPETVAATEAAKMRLSAETVEDLRTLTVTSTSFADAGGFGQSGTKVKGGDILRVDNWSVKEDSGGIIYSSVGELEGDVVGAHVVTSTERVVVFPASGSMDTAADAYVTTTGVGTVIFTADDTDSFVPAMYAVTDASGGEVAAKDFNQTILSPSSDADNGAAYLAITYTAGAITSTAGSFSVVTTNLQRTFTDLTAPYAGITTGGANTYHILVKDAFDVYRPMFEVVSKTSSSILVVRQFSEAELPVLASASNVSYKVSVFAHGTATIRELGGNGSVSVAYSSDPDIVTDAAIDLADYGAYTMTADDRILTIPGSNLLTAGVEAGDFVFSDTGTLMFEVVAAPTADTLTKAIVKLATNAGVALAENVALTNFGCSVREKGLRADFVVRRVISDTELEVKESPSSPNSIPGDQVVHGMIWYQDVEEALPVSVTVGDSVVGVSYTIEKTVAGANLAGDILVNYAVIRDDLVGLQEITATNYASVLGDDVIDNPLGLAARIYFSNSSANMFVVQVKADTTEGWLAAAEATKSDRVYNIVPLTQTESVLAMWRAHVIEQSLPDNKRERILWQSHRFLQDVVKAEWALADNATVSRDADGIQTVEIGKDLLALGVAIGDDFTGTWFNGSVYTEFAGRITDVELLGSVTTVSMLPDGEVPLSTTDMVVTGYEITSRPLSLAELKEEVKAYPKTILERRIRNIYPDQCVVEFSDNTGDGETTGIYGGGAITETAGGFYYCVVEAAKRTAFGPAKPLTKRGGAGIYQTLDTFAEAPGFQDEILDSGNYYMEQRTGAGSNVYTIRALTTDTRELITAEESVTPQIDSFVRKLRAQLTPLLGPEILDQRFFDLISTVAQATVTRTLTDKELKAIKLLSIRESPDTADTFLMEYEVEPFFSGARGVVTIYF